MDSICEKHSITSPQGRNLLLKKLLYEEGYRFIVKYELLGEVYAQSGPERALIQKLYQGFFLSRRII